MAVVAGGLAAAGALGGAMISSSGAQSAANTQANAANNATALQQQMYYQNLGLEMPWVQGSTAAEQQLNYWLGLGNPSGSYNSQGYWTSPTGSFVAMGNAPGTGSGGGGTGTGSGNGFDASLYGFSNAHAQGGSGNLGSQYAAQGDTWNPGGTGQLTGSFGQYTQPYNFSDYMSEPYYKWQVQQGLANTQAGMAASGMYGSGNNANALESQMGGIASQNYLTGNQLWLQPYSLISQAAGEGAVASAANLGTNYTTQAGSNMMSAGNALATGQINSANAYTGGLGTMTNQFSQLALLNGLSGGSASGSYNPSFNYAGVDNFLNSGVDASTLNPYTGAWTSYQ